MESFAIRNSPSEHLCKPRISCTQYEEIGYAIPDKKAVLNWFGFKRFKFKNIYFYEIIGLTTTPSTTVIKK